MSQLAESDLEILLEGFKYQDSAKVLRKLDRFMHGGASKLHVVSDFDLTLTAGKIPGQNLGTWDVMDALMPAEGVAKHTEIYHSFRPIEIAGQLTEEMTIEKWTETLDLITSYPMNIAEIETAFLTVASLRPGAKAIFDVCKTKGIPTVILSAGIGNVIEIMADHYDIYPDFILSTDLTLDETGQVIGWDKASLTHMMNKHEIGHGEIAALRETRPNILLMGDVTDDVNMVKGDADVIRVRVLDPRKGERFASSKTLEASFNAGYDLLVEHSLEPVSLIIQKLSY